MAVLEDQPPDPEGGGGGEQVGDDGQRGDQRRPDGEEQEQEAEREHDADEQRRPVPQGLREVVVLRGAAADEGASGQCAAEPVDGSPNGPARRVGLGDRLYEGKAARPELRCQHAGDAGVAAGGRGHGRGLTLRRGDLERSWRAGAEGALHLLIAHP